MHQSKHINQLKHIRQLKQVINKSTTTETYKSIRTNKSSEAY